MIGALASAVVICALSVVTGRGVLLVCRPGASPWLAAPVGLALLMVVADAAVHLPGHAATAFVVLLAIAVAGGALLWRRRTAPLPLEAVAIGGLAFLALMIPFYVNGRFGVVGVSFNNDLSAHLLWVRELMDPGVVAPPSNYPLGPHAVVAAVAQGLGASPEDAFTGLLVAVSVLGALAARGCVDMLALPWRVLVSIAAALAYLAAAYYSEGAFKETIQVLLVLGLAAGMMDLAADTRPRVTALMPLGALAAGSVVNYSYFGLLWPGGAFALWLAAQAAIVAVRRRPAAVVAIARAWLLPALAGLAAIVVVLVPELAGIRSFFAGNGVTPTATGAAGVTNLGNLAAKLPLAEAFGVWHNQDFRLTPVGLKTGGFAALAAVAAIYGAAWSIARRELALLATVVVTLAAWLWLDSRQTPYFAAKALVILSPLVLLLALRALFAPQLVAGPAERIFVRVAAVALLVLAGQSTLSTLRYSFIGDQAHSSQLESLAGRIHGGGNVLLLTLDDYMRFELWPHTVQSPVGTRPGKVWAYGQPYDFDSVPAAELDRYRWVIDTRTAVGSAPPPNLRLVTETQAYRLWERVGPTAPRQVLAEGAAAGARLNCSKPLGRALSHRTGRALIRPPSVISPALPHLAAGATEHATMSLGRGRWDLSTPYNSTQPVRFRIQPRGQERDLDVTLPANLDRPGARWPIGTVTLDRPATLDLTITVGASGLSAAGQIGYPNAIIATPLDGWRTVPLRKACGRYVDWYQAAPAT